MRKVGRGRYTYERRQVHDRHEAREKDVWFTLAKGYFGQDTNVHGVSLLKALSKRTDMRSNRVAVITYFLSLIHI